MHAISFLKTLSLALAFVSLHNKVACIPGHDQLGNLEIHGRKLPVRQVTSSDHPIGRSLYGSTKPKTILSPTTVKDANKTERGKCSDPGAKCCGFTCSFCASPEERCCGKGLCDPGFSCCPKADGCCEPLNNFLACCNS